MRYKSIDVLQRTLGEGVFGYAKDCKKAAGRALGTFVASWFNVIVPETKSLADLRDQLLKIERAGGMSNVSR